MTNEEAVEKLKILKEDYWDDDGYGHESKLYDDTALALDMAIKSLEERKTGKWISAYPDIEPNPMFAFCICSICGFRQSLWHELNYCPNCGAKMEGAEE